MGCCSPARRATDQKDAVLALIPAADQQMSSSLLKPSRLMPLLFVGVGALIILAGTPHGIGFEHDSVFYWSAAVGLLEGRGISRIDGSGLPVPITHFPPLYPAALALAAWVSRASVTEVARELAGALFGINLALIWFLARSATGSTLAASLTAGLLLLSPQFLERHLWAMSEPLHFALLLSTTELLMKYLKEPTRRALIAAALLAGSAYLNRYVGLALILSSLVALLLLGQGPRRRKLQDAAAFVSVALLPGILWQGRNLRLTGAAANRVLGWHPLDLGKLKEAGATLASWAPLDFSSLEVRAALMGLVAVVVGWYAFRLARGPLAGPSGLGARSLLSLTGIHALSYSALLAVSTSVFDASTRLDPRALSPLFLLGILTAGVIGWRIFAAGGSRLGRVVAAGSIGMFAVAYGVRSLELIQNSAKNGLGFSSNGWRNSETIRLVTQLDPQLVIYSNEALPVYFLSGHPAYSVPEKIDPVKDSLREDFPAFFAEMRGRLETGQAVLVLFRPHSLPAVLPELDLLTEGLTEFGIAEDGIIYRAGEATSQARLRIGFDMAK